jgi:hypothetical protein
MGLKSTLRALQAQERRVQRDAQRRLRELERRAKEQAKLSAIEQARLEVETYENRLDLLLSVHKERGELRDWNCVAATLPSPAPQRSFHHELRAKQLLCIDFEKQFVTVAETLIDQARMRDEQEYKEAVQSHSQEISEWESDTNLARRILCGELKAYTEALTEFNPLSEIADLGSSVHFVVHNSKLLECTLKVNGVQAIPSEVKSLTASGKVSVKAMPKSRFHEIYQDYVCGCILRVAREVFALLPIEALIITASADWFDSGTGRIEERPVLSAAIQRVQLEALDFERLDPSDAIERLLHRGDFKSSRKLGAFQPITPLMPADLTASPSQLTGYTDLLSTARRLRKQMNAELTELRSKGKSQPDSEERIP